MRRLAAAIAILLTVCAVVLAGGSITGYSVSESYASCYLSTPSLAEAVTTGTAEKVPGTFTEDLSSSDWTVSSAGLLTYTGTNTRHVTILATISSYVGSNNTISRWYIAKGGSIDTNSRIDRKHGVGADVGAMTVMLDDLAATNDTYQVFMDNDSNDSMSVTYCYIHVD